MNGNLLVYWLVRGVLMTSLGVMIGGCSTFRSDDCDEKRIYKNSPEDPRLEVPGDLSHPDHGDSIVIPELGPDPEPQPTHVRCLEEPPTTVPESEQPGDYERIEEE